MINIIFADSGNTFSQDGLSHRVHIEPSNCYGGPRYHELEVAGSTLVQPEKNTSWKPLVKSRGNGDCFIVGMGNLQTSLAEPLKGTFAGHRCVSGAQKYFPDLSYKNST